MNQDPLSILLPKFIDNLKEKGRSPSTILAYTSDLEQMVAFLTKMSKALPQDVRQEHLSAFRDHLLAQKYTAKSTSRKLNAIKTFFRWIKDNGYVLVDPSKDVSHPRIESTTPKFLTQIEYRALRDMVRADSRIAAIVELIIQTGMRISEVANLKMANLEKESLYIEKYATQPERTVPLNAPAQEALDMYLKERKSVSPYVFVSKNGKPLAVRNIRASIDRYMIKAGISNHSINDLRTTFIVESLKRGVDIVTISQAAGHRRLSTTERYLELAGIKEAGKKQELEEL